MLCFDIRSLEARAEPVDGWLTSDDPIWGDSDARPVGDGVHVEGRISSAGHGRFFLTGRFDGVVVTTCRRCLADVTVPVASDVQLLFAESDLEEAEEDDVVAIPVGERELDLRPAVREEWLLAVPAFALCRESCQGICPSCGVDRNTGDCSCRPSSDPRWDALRTLRD